ncbi:MAG TPA: hypothetical protein DEP28_12685 [Bacteroidetes bacterium]|nr:hypothetical protein [Bacteroidota bacterium]HCN37618.1 hypothetical protein [Bacteroidota bacterium]
MFSQESLAGDSCGRGRDCGFPIHWNWLPRIFTNWTNDTNESEKKEIVKCNTRRSPLQETPAGEEWLTNFFKGFFSRKLLQDDNGLKEIAGQARNDKKVKGVVY